MGWVHLRCAVNDSRTLRVRKLPTIKRDAALGQSTDFQMRLPLGESTSVLTSGRHAERAALLPPAQQLLLRGFVFVTEPTLIKEDHALTRHLILSHFLSPDC